jgi:hypothetical protein
VGNLRKVIYADTNFYDKFWLPLSAPNVFLEGFRGLTAVVINNTTFWHITPCSSKSTDISEEHITFIFRVE